MTTSHRPTYHAAIGRANAGGYRYDAPRAQYSSRDMATHMTLKTRGDIVQRDQIALREALLASENKHKQTIKDEKARKGLLDDDDDDAGPRGAAARDGEPGESAEPPLLPDGVDLSQFDDEDEDIAAAAAAASRGGGGGESSDDDDSSDDEDDEDAELARELDLIRREREEAKLRAAQAEAAEAEAAAAASLARNPLMPMAGAQAGPTFGNDTPFGASGGVKRRWDDDVVFKNQAKGDLVNKQKKRFINDSIRSDFHRSFMNRYVQ